MTVPIENAHFGDCISGWIQWRLPLHETSTPLFDLLSSHRKMSKMLPAMYPYKSTRSLNISVVSSRSCPESSFKNHTSLDLCTMYSMRRVFRVLPTLPQDLCNKILKESRSKVQLRLDAQPWPNLAYADFQLWLENLPSLPWSFIASSQIPSEPVCFVYSVHALVD